MKAHILLASSLFATMFLFGSQDLQKQSLEEKKLIEVTTSISIDAYGKFTKTYKGTDQKSSLALQVAIDCHHSEESGYIPDKASVTLSAQQTKENITAFLNLYSHIIWAQNNSTMEDLHKCDAFCARSGKADFIKNYVNHANTHEDDGYKTTIFSTEIDGTPYKILKTTKNEEIFTFRFPPLVSNSVNFQYSYSNSGRDNYKNIPLILSHQQFSFFKANDSYMGVIKKLFNDQGIYVDIRTNWKLSTGYMSATEPKSSKNLQSLLSKNDGSKSNSSSSSSSSSSSQASLSCGGQASSTSTKS